MKPFLALGVDARKGLCTDSVTLAFCKGPALVDSTNAVLGRNTDSSQLE
jgi:hypothetical protein